MRRMRRPGCPAAWAWPGRCRRPPPLCERGRTQLTGVVAAVIVLIVIALLAELLFALPRAVPSAIVIGVWG